MDAKEQQELASVQQSRPEVNSITQAPAPGLNPPGADNSGVSLLAEELFENEGSILNAIPCGVVIADRAGIICRTNERLTSMLGYTQDELKGSPLDMLFLDSLQQPHLLWIGNRFETYAHHKSGVERPVEIGISLLEHDGRMFAFLAINDIADYKVAERELLQTKNDLRAIINNLPAMIGYWDVDLHNRFANDAYRDWFGWKPEDIQGKHIREVIGEELFAANYPYMAAALEGRTQGFERAITDPTGRTRYSQASYIPDIREEGVRGFYVLVTDITPQKQTEMALFEEKERARYTKFYRRCRHYHR